MQTEIGGSQRTAQVAALRGFGFGALVVGLVALITVAALRETAQPKPQRVATKTEMNQAERPAITAEEEAFARALWPIHAQVKQDAVKMTFAGLAFKLGDIKQVAVKDRVAPLTPMFEAALGRASGLKPPVSMKGVHRDYLDAIRLYRDSSVTMVQVAVDADDRHLMLAQEMSAKAADLTLKVGEVLWPGEYKPN